MKVISDILEHDEGNFRYSNGGMKVISDIVEHGDSKYSKEGSS